ncbi:MAG: sensor histidine kinase, partial [Chitinophagales bacterium]
MDTKSKKSRPFAAWLSFFAAVSILFTLFIACVSAVVWADGDYSILKAPFQSYKNSMMFKEQTANYFEELFDRVQRMPEIGQETDVYPLDREGENVKFLAAKNQVITNMKGGLSFTMNGMPVSPVGYEYFWYFDGNKVWVVDHGQTVDTRRLDSGYRRLINPSKMFWYSDAEMSGTRVFLAVKDNLEKNPYEQSTYYWDQQMLPVIGGICVGFAVLALLLLIYAFLKRQEKRYFERRLSSWSGSLLLELKLIISVMVLTLSVRVADSGNQFDFYGWFLLIPCWWFYLMLIDLIHNRKRFFTNNLINWLFKRYRKIENMYPWQKNLLMRAYLLVAAEAILAPISVVILLNGGDGGFFVAFLIAIFGVYLIYRYLRRFNRTIQDYGKLTDQIEIMKNGDMTTRLNLNPDADMYAAAQNLNSVQEGMSIAVAERIRSERMKMELITNVSHDLKTPLTSIISYVDLLNREDNLSDQVKDYVQILAQKSDRLNNLIQDLFDLSKASSENMSLDMERLDLAR